MEIYRVADTESAQEFWDAALGRLKAFVETQRQDSGVVIDDRPKGRMLSERNPDPEAHSEKP